MRCIREGPIVEAAARIEILIDGRPVRWTRSFVERMLRGDQDLIDRIAVRSERGEVLDPSYILAAVKGAWAPSGTARPDFARQFDIDGMPLPGSAQKTKHLLDLYWRGVSGIRIEPPSADFGVVELGFPPTAEQATKAFTLIADPGGSWTQAHCLVVFVGTDSNAPGDVANEFFVDSDDDVEGPDDGQPHMEHIHTPELRFGGVPQVKVNVTWVPGSLGSKDIQLGVIVDAVEAVAAEALLEALVVEPSQLVLGPNPLDFGSVKVGTHPTQTLLVGCTGPLGVHILEPAPPTTASGDDFSLIVPDGMQWPLEVPAVAPVEFTVEFEPTKRGISSATLTVAPKAAKAAATVDLTAFATQATASVVDPISGAGIGGLDFGTVYIGASYELEFAIKNVGDAELCIGPLVDSIQPPDQGFGLVAPSTLVVPVNDMSEPFVVTFHPTVDGAHAATLIINTDADNSPVKVTVEGQGAYKYHEVRRTDPDRSEIRDETDTWVATLTDGCRMMTVRRAAPRDLKESWTGKGGHTHTASVSNQTSVRLRAEPYKAPPGLDLVVPWTWIDDEVANTQPDVLDVAMEYIGGVASYGPELTPGDPKTRESGADVFDYLQKADVIAGMCKKPKSKFDKCLDCSGYVRMVLGYRLGYPLACKPDGKGLPRRSRQLCDDAPGVMVIPKAAGPLKSVPYARLDPGDLVFFDAKDPKDAKCSIDHVGIYLGVDGGGLPRFISSRKTADGPTLGDLGGPSVLDKAKYWPSAFRAARRP